MFVCPLFHEFRMPNKTGREYQLQAKNRSKLLQYFELYGFNSSK